MTVIKGKSLFRDFYITIKEKDADNRTIGFLVSTSDIDRDQEIIDPKGWKLKNYKKNPVFLWAHDHRGLPIARGVKFKSNEEGLLIDYQFATADEYPFADTVYKLYNGGYLNAVSVGFIPLKWEDGNPEKNRFRRRYFEQELLEVSAVAVPSNFNALMQARGSGCIGEDEFVKIKTFFDGYDLPDQGQGLGEDGKKETFNCECIQCGYKVTSEKHCKDLNCPKCGGQMRREERPGPGRSLPDQDAFELEKLLQDEISGELALKPYANEHACRINDPDKYDRFARKNCAIKHDGKCIDVIYGIKGGKSEIQAYRYQKDIWAEADAKAHCKDHNGAFEAAKCEIEGEDKGAVPYKPEGKADEGRGWDASAAVKRLVTWAGGKDDMNWGKFQRGFAWFDPENKETLGAYKLPHHDISDGSIITVWRGVTAAMAALLGARGGVDIPDSDKKGVYNHLKQHYAQFDKEPPELRIFEEEAIKELFEGETLDASLKETQSHQANQATEGGNGKSNDDNVFEQILTEVRQLKRETSNKSDFAELVAQARQVVEGN